MVRNKKKAPGRPKKEFISHKPKTVTKDWPGRPRKTTSWHKIVAQVPAEVVWFVKQSVDTSQKKDIIILILFLLSFLLFVVSLYFTFIKDKKAEELRSSTEITNIDKGNINYTNTTDPEILEETDTIDTTDAQILPPTTLTTDTQTANLEQQIITNFYQAVNAIDISGIYTLTEARLEESNVFKTYYSKTWLSKFSSVIVAPKIIVTNIQEKSGTTNPNIKNFTYTLEYTLAKNQQKFTEERSTVLIKKGDDRRIGKLLCETKWCSTMPFFNPDKYK